MAGMPVLTGVVLMASEDINRSKRSWNAHILRDNFLGEVRLLAETISMSLFVFLFFLSFLCLQEVVLLHIEYRCSSSSLGTTKHRA